jgi:drug/metabolite transporter (DMT)-like permease
MNALPKRVLAALITVYLVWGSTYLAVHIALTSFSPFFLMGSRFIVAGILLFAWLKLHGARNPRCREWFDGGLIGMLLLGGAGLTAVAQQYVSSGLVAIFIASSPVMFALWTCAFGIWPTGREWAGILAGVSGAAFLASGASFYAQPAGLIALVCSISCWTLGSVLSQRKLKPAPGAMGYASEMLIGGAFLIAVAFIRHEPLITSVNVAALAAWVYLVTIGSLVVFSAYMYLLSAASPMLASSYAYVNPVVAVFLSVLIADEKIGVREVAAVIVIFAGVALLTSGKTTRMHKGKGDKQDDTPSATRS